MPHTLRSVLLASTALGFLLSGSAQAADATAETLAALQAQISALQKQIADLQAKETSRAKTEATQKTEKPAATTAQSGGKEILPGVSVKLGGYLAAEAAYRDKNAETDMGSNPTGIPFKNELDSHTDEYRGSARSTRLSLLAEGSPNADTNLAAFVEVDFMGSDVTSNSRKTNSYSPRLRHAYMTYDRTDWGFYVLGGQAYSLTTLFKSGLTPRKEVGVATIDASGPPGYVYTRGPMLRLVKEFGNKKWNFGLAFEEPEVNFGEANVPTSLITAYNTGVGQLANATYSTDYAPDIVAKLAYDSDYGHYEVFGLTRFFRDVVNSTGHNNYKMGFGGGVGAYVPVLPGKLDLAANFIAGKGIGRYSSASLADIAFTPTGEIKPLTQMAALVGLIGHPTPTWDIYFYAGAEKVMREAQSGGGKTYGYGNFTADNSGCYDLTGGTCQAQTEMVWQLSPGVWKTVYKGDYGNMKVGAQYSLTRRNAFSGANNQAPHAVENTGMLSFRYSPF